MKKRKRARVRRQNLPRQNFMEAFANGARRRRKAWTFERLEDRFFLSASPLDNLQWQSISSDTPEGATAIAARELDWYNKLAGASSNTIQTASLPNDPYFQYQWHLLNTGQIVNDFQFNPTLQPIFGVAGNDINVAPVWDMGITGATGNGINPNNPVLVAVNDTGIQLSHPDLAANISPTYRLDVLDGDTDPSPSGTSGEAGHGTSVAGLIAAIQNNALGGTGVAPGAKIAPVRLIPTGGIGGSFNVDLQTANALLLNGAPIDVSNNSWGPGEPVANPRQTEGPGPNTLQALQNLATQGRGGKGTVVVFASGNDAGPQTSPGFQNFGNWGSAGSNGYNDSRYVISVGAVDHDGSVNNSDGTLTLYPEGGPSTLVVAPTGSIAINIGSDTGQGSGIYTTDLTNGGFNVPPLQPSGLEVDGDFFPDTNYTSIFNGTSAAAPQVSGVVALMLQANPDLSYRDVEEILVRSARQNDQYDPSWVVNGRPFFRDPFPTQLGGPDDDTTALVDPLFTPRVPNLYTNGAGYTVSQGRTGNYGSEYAYGHGEVDAKLAVQLAQQWTTKKQTLAPELTWTTFVLLPAQDIRAAEATNMASGRYLVPGGLELATAPNFDAFFNEFFADMPFSGTPPPVNTRGTIPFTFNVPPIYLGQNNLMDIESVEVKLDLTGDANAMDYLRIALQSPDGTISDLTNYQLNPPTIVNSFQTTPEAQFGINTGGFFVDPPGMLDGNQDGNNTFSWVYTTKRDWGERSDFEPVVDPATGFATSIKPWELHFENYSAANLGISGMELVFHGHPIGNVGTPVERVLGKVGVDAGYVDVDNTLKGRNDNKFNFNRYITVPDPSLQSADLIRIPASPADVAALGSFDPSNPSPQEQFGSNVTVNATATIDGTLTGTPTATSLAAHDLVGATTTTTKPEIGDSIQITNGAANGQIRRITAYDATTGTMTLDTALANVPAAGDTFTITKPAPIAQFVTGADGNYYFDLPAGTYRLQVVDPLGRTAKLAAGSDPVYKPSWTVTIDTTDAFTRTAGGPNSDGNFVEFNQLNFLLDPGAAPAAQVVTSGMVYADLDGNGKRDSGEPAASGFTVFFDANKNGVKEAGEQSTTTDANGNYSLTLTDAAIAGGTKDTLQIGVVPPAGWTATNPNPALRAVYGGPGDTFTGLDFGIMPPPGAVPVDPGSPGTVVGVVYNDTNHNGVRDGGEDGVSGFHVFVDDNINGTFDAGEHDAVTDAGGAFFISNVIPGTLSVHVDVNSPYALTQPASGSRTVTLTSGGAVTGVQFGVQNLATRDFGDLGAPYPTLLADNGARNTIVPGFLLGTKIDGEVDGQPTADATGDDVVGSDEDGVAILDSQGNSGGSIHAGDNTLQIKVQGVGGYLNAWVDWNGDGDWSDPGEQVFTDLHVNPGTYPLTVTAPVNLVGGALAARFRWGSAGVSYTGSDIAGEVEDYRLKNSVLAGDYNSDGNVNMVDYSIWVNTFGSTSDLRADGNHNGVVDAGDYSVWRDHMGATSGAGAGSLAAEELPRAKLSAAQLEAVLSKFAGGAPTPAQIAYMTSLGLPPTIVQVGNSYHIGVTLGAGNGASGAGGVVATSAPTQAGAGSSTTTPAIVVATPLDVTFLQFATSFHAQTSANVVQSSSGTTATKSDSDLLLLDQALADLGTPRVDQLDHVLSMDVDGLPEGGQDLSDLALAAVFDNETDWRNAI